MAEVLKFGPQAERRDELGAVDYDKWLRDPPERDWVVEGCFMRGHVGLISGIGGVGKSLLMQQLATCAVLGRPWLGIPLKAGKALMLACEDDDDELQRRQRDINRSLGVNMGDVLDAGLDPIARDDGDNILMSLNRREWRMERPRGGLLDKLILRCRRTGVQYLILDPVAKIFGGRQEDGRNVSEFITEMHRVARVINGIVILAQHPSRSGRNDGSGESGSVQWQNSVRSRLYFHEDRDNNLTIEGMKSNYGRKLAPVPLRWERGVFIRVEAEPARDYSEPAGYR